MRKSIDEMNCFIGALLVNKQLNISLIDLLFNIERENQDVLCVLCSRTFLSLDDAVTFI